MNGKKKKKMEAAEEEEDTNETRLIWVGHSIQTVEVAVVTLS